MNGINRILIIALIAIANAQAQRNLRVGKTVNLFSKNDSTKTTVSDIFNGFNGSHYIEKKNDGLYNYEKYSGMCMLFESLKGYFYPNVFIDKKLSNNVTSKLFHDIDILRDEYLDINEIYVNNQKFRYGIVKLCKTIEVKSLNIEVINTTHFSKFASNGHYDILMNKTVVFRLKRDDETHYISSVSSGTCIFQIYVNEATKCEHEGKKIQDTVDDFFKTSIHRSSFLSVDKNRDLEKRINEYYFLNDLDYSVFTFPHEGVIHHDNILKMFENKNIVSVTLRPLPELPAMPELRTKHIAHPSRNLIKRDDISPGDAFNLEELLHGKSKFDVYQNLLWSTNDGVTSSSAAYSYSNCPKYFENKTPKLENGKLDVFQAMLKLQNYGIDPKYSIEGKTCLKFIVCSGFSKQKLQIPSPMVVKLNENSKNNVKYNIFEEKNIMLWFSEGDETHNVFSTEKGECLSQTLVYPDEADNYFDKSILDLDPIFNGVILSATGNHYLEERVRNLVNNDFKYVFGNKRNVTAIVKVFEELEYSSLTRKALLSMYLYEMF